MENNVKNAEGGGKYNSNLEASREAGRVEGERFLEGERLRQLGEATVDVVENSKNSDGAKNEYVKMKVNGEEWSGDGDSILVDGKLTRVKVRRSGERGDDEKNDSDVGGEESESKEEKTRAEMIEVLENGDKKTVMALLVENGIKNFDDWDALVNDSSVEGTKRLKGLYEKWETRLNEDKMEEKDPEDVLEINMTDKERKLERTRGYFVEMSARRRGVFGRKSGGEQEKLYNGAMEDYRELAVGTIKGQMDNLRNGLEAKKKEEATWIDPDKMDAWLEIQNKKIENELNAKCVELWIAENEVLVEQTKYAMDSGNVMRKIGKLMDELPKVAKIAASVGLGVAIGAVTGGLGLGFGIAGGMALAAGQAAFFTRVGSKNSAINANENMNVEERVHEELLKDQARAHANVAEWLTKQHTEAILKDKYDNRKRTIIAVSVATALSALSHIGSNLFASAEVTATNGGDVAFGDDGTLINTSDVGGDVGAEVSMSTGEASADLSEEMNFSDVGGEATGGDVGAEVVNDVPDVVTRNGDGWFDVLKRAGVDMADASTKMQPGTEGYNLIMNSEYAYPMANGSPGVLSGGMKLSEDFVKQLIATFK